MKPEQFIREYGVEKARDLLDQLHKLGCPDDMKITVINGMWQRTSNGFTYPELKRLVESLDRIAQLGGLSKAKDHLVYLISFGSEFAGVSKDEIKELQQDVAVHESIYGGGDE
ncbi:hypothetical protein ABTF40_03830 [Acinetobacter baumannii]